MPSERTLELLERAQQGMQVLRAMRGKNGQARDHVSDACLSETRMYRASTPPIGRFAMGRVHKASSAESIVKHVLRGRGWSTRWKAGKLTGRQHLALLEDVRQYGRAWLRHEMGGFFEHYSNRDEDYVRTYLSGGSRERRSIEMDLGILSATAEISGSSAMRSLSDRLLSPLKRTFDRMRQFVKELIFAGAISMSGPQMDQGDEEILNRSVQMQVDYLDKFEREIIANPPSEIGQPDFLSQVILVEPPRSVGQRIAQAEQYGNSVWQSTINAGRGIVAQQKVFQSERRVHLLAEHQHKYCQTCIKQSLMGWQPLGTLNEIGDSECMGSCDCYFEWMGPDKKIYLSPWGRHNPKAYNIPGAPGTRLPGIAYPADKPNLPPPPSEQGGSSIPGEPIKKPIKIKPLGPKPNPPLTPSELEELHFKLPPGYEWSS